MTSTAGSITVYGAPWCPHCKRVKKFLAGHRVPYENIDVDDNPDAVEVLKGVQGGGQIIPTVVYGDGTHEVNPTDEALARRIGLTLAAERSVYDLVIVGGGLAPADDSDFVRPLVKGAIAGGAEMDARPYELLFPRHFQAPVRRPCGHNDGVRGELGSSRQRDDQVLTVELHCPHRYGRQELHPVPSSLLDKPIGQLGTGDPVGEPRVIVDPVADPGLSSQGTGVHDDGVDALAGGVDGRRQAGSG